MGRFSPRGHNLTPYMEGDSALTRGMLQGFNTVTGVLDRSQRTAIADREQRSQEAYREALMADIAQRMRNLDEERAREWDFRPEAEVVAEGPSSQQAPMFAGETTVPPTQGMAGPPDQWKYGGNSPIGMDERVPAKKGESSQGFTDPQGMAQIPPIQGSNIPGDMFPRVNVPGGSMLAQPRSYHQGNEALQGAHEELYGDPMPGVSSALAQGLAPYQPRATSGLSREEWAWREDYKNKNKPPDATTRNQQFRQAENRAEALAAAYVGEGMDMMEALDRAAQETGVYPDATLVQRTVDANYNRLMTIYRYIGMPPTNHHAQVIRNMAIRGMSLGAALAPYAQAVGRAEFQDPQTGEWRLFTQDDLNSITEYVGKYGSVDNASGGLTITVPQGSWVDPEQE